MNAPTTAGTARRISGMCDVTGCSGQTYMGWRPDTAPRGRQVCESHWHRHRDVWDSFDLFEAFGFKRPERLPKPVVKNIADFCGCGRELESGHRLCTVCAVERERKRKRQYYHDKKNSQPKPVPELTVLQCRQCGRERLPGHTYCEKCADRRKKQSNRERRRRAYRKAQNV